MLADITVPIPEAAVEPFPDDIIGLAATLEEGPLGLTLGLVSSPNKETHEAEWELIITSISEGAIEKWCSRKGPGVRLRPGDRF